MLGARVGCACWVRVLGSRVGFACWVRVLGSRVGFGRPCPGAVATFETLRAATVETVANHALVKPAMRAMIYHIDHELTLQYHRAKIQYHTIWYGPPSIALVWAPKYRKKILTGAVGDRIRELLFEIGDAYQIEIEELEVSIDDVHIFCSFPQSCRLRKW